PRKRLLRRPDRKQIEDLVFTVIVPSILDEPAFVAPAVREQIRIAVQHPPKIDAFVNLCSVADNFRVRGETLFCCEDTAEKQRRVARRYIAPTSSFARFLILPMVKPAVLVECSIRKIVERDA